MLEKQPSTQAYTGLGIVLQQQGRTDKAIARFQEAITADPANAAAYDQLGSILVLQGNLEEAVSIYRSLIRHVPSAAAHDELAQVLSRLGRTKEASDERVKAQALRL